MTKCSKCGNDSDVKFRCCPKCGNDKSLALYNFSNLAYQCNACGTLNSTSLKYCQKCGVHLRKTCKQFWSDNPTSVEYCGCCGVKIDSAKFTLPEIYGDKSMAEITLISVRIDSALKENAERIFSALGLTSTQAITLFYQQVEHQQGMPFRDAMQNPNTETIQAIEDAMKRRSLESTTSTDAFFEDLGI